MRRKSIHQFNQQIAVEQPSNLMQLIAISYQSVLLAIISDAQQKWKVSQRNGSPVSPPLTPKPLGFSEDNMHPFHKSLHNESLPFALTG